MGIHTGPVYRVADINANRNVAGGGINIAQRVMDCGDGGHILVSGAVAEVLSQVSTWNSKLHDLGEAEVKHGVRVHVYNLYTEEAGNPRIPNKVDTQTRKSQAQTMLPVRDGLGQPNPDSPFSDSSVSHSSGSSLIVEAAKHHKLV
jgi:hypothetical protein